MPLQRRTADVPGLARLLADAPRDRKVVLAEIWGIGSPDQPGAMATLYRHMTDRGRLAQLLEGSPETERLLFRRLVGASSGRTVIDLADRLPFSDEAIRDGLRWLEYRGLVWKVAAAGRENVADGARWAIPRDIASSIGSEWRHSRASAMTTETQTESDSPSFGARVDRFTLGLEKINVAGASRDTLFALVAGAIAGGISLSGRSRIQDHALSCGAALGILERRGRSVNPGARAARWHVLETPEQTRALARLWQVDPKVSGDLPAPLRSALLRLLGELDENVWYRLDSLARIVASQSVKIATPESSAVADALSRSPGRSLSRRDLDRAVETLGLIGVLDVALDRQDRLVAVRLSSLGVYPLA